MQLVSNLEHNEIWMLARKIRTLNRFQLIIFDSSRQTTGKILIRIIIRWTEYLILFNTMFFCKSTVFYDDFPLSFGFKNRENDKQRLLNHVKFRFYRFLKWIAKIFNASHVKQQHHMTLIWTHKIACSVHYNGCSVLFGFDKYINVWAMENDVQIAVLVAAFMNLL